MQLRTGQTAVVTGAASGIGLALAERFATAGLNVVLADVDAAALARRPSGSPPTGCRRSRSCAT